MTTAASAASWLAQHVGKDHRLYALDAQHVRCKDCCQTGVLGPTTPDPQDPRSAIKLPIVGASSPTHGKREIPNLHDPDACQEHPGYWATNCGPCRSEQLATDTPLTPAPPAGHARPQDNPAWNALKAQLADRRKP